MAVMWHGVAMLPRLREWHANGLLPFVMNEANDLNGEQPLHLNPFASTASLVVRSWDPDKKLTGCQVLALMVFSFWVTVGEDPAMCESLYDAWPIAEAVMLCPREEVMA